MNRLSTEKQAAIISALVEGNSIRSTERMVGVHRDTVMRLGVRVGNAVADYMDRTFRDLPTTEVQVDEIWAYVGKKQRHVAESDDPKQVGDVWTWVALDADTKLVPSFLVGKRDQRHAVRFANDLAGRLRNRVQISSDGLNSYRWAINQAFGGKVDYGAIVKTYAAEPAGAGRYSPPKVISVETKTILGAPDMNRVSTSYVERQNLTMRMQMRRFTRLTNAFSKKLDNLKAAVALHFGHYNLCRVHRTVKTTPAIACGVEGSVWRVEDLVDLARAR